MPLDQQNLILTVDGPSASGKSSLSRFLAKKLGATWVSTGAFYRGLALVAVEENVSLDDEMSLALLCKNPQWQVVLNSDQTRVFYNNRDISSEVYSVQAGNLASRISQLPMVRKNLLSSQRQCSYSHPLLIAEGRDCGTVVFPDAFLKVYLTADEGDRVQRRAKDSGRDIGELSQLIRIRDERDSGRSLSPLLQAEDALYIDSSDKTLEEVAGIVLDCFRNKYRGAYKREYPLTV